MPNWIAKLAGVFIRNKIKLEDGTMNDTKKWYQSKAIWTGITATLIGIYNVVATNALPAFGVTAPVIPDWIFAILGTIGVYTRAKADTKIG